MSDTITAATDDPFDLAAAIAARMAQISVTAARCKLFGRTKQYDHLMLMVGRGLGAIRSGETGRMGRVLEILNHVELDQ